MATVYYNFFNDSCKHFKKSFEKKMKTGNTLKNDGEPNYKTLVISDISKYIYSFVFGRYFLPSEIKERAGEKSSPLFAIHLL